jgi:hypothetical protein
MTNVGSLAVHEKWAQLCDSQGAELAEARAENQRLWAALGAPKELQQYVAAGCSEAQRKSWHWRPDVPQTSI